MNRYNADLLTNPAYTGEIAPFKQKTELMDRKFQELHRELLPKKLRGLETGRQVFEQIMSLDLLGLRALHDDAVRRDAVTEEGDNASFHLGTIEVCKLSATGRLCRYDYMNPGIIVTGIPPIRQYTAGMHFNFFDHTSQPTPGFGVMVESLIALDLKRYIELPSHKMKAEKIFPSDAGEMMQDPDVYAFTTNVFMARFLNERLGFYVDSIFNKDRPLPREEFSDWTTLVRSQPDDILVSMFVGHRHLLTNVLERINQRLERTSDIEGFEKKLRRFNLLVNSCDYSSADSDSVNEWWRLLSVLE